mgnify:CR=1 FL=1
MKKLSVIFKIKYAKNSQKYIKAFIFRDKETMYKFYELQLEKTGQKDKLNFSAMFQPFKIISFKNKKEKEKNHMGNLLFYQGATGSGVVSHECGHASLYWFCENNPHPKEYKVIKNMEKEEELLWTLGYLVSQFWKNYYKFQEQIES